MTEREESLSNNYFQEGMGALKLKLMKSCQAEEQVERQLGSVFRHVLTLQGVPTSSPVEHVYTTWLSHSLIYAVMSTLLSRLAAVARCRATGSFDGNFSGYLVSMIYAVPLLSPITSHCAPGTFYLLAYSQRIDAQSCHVHGVRYTLLQVQSDHD